MQSQTVQQPAGLLLLRERLRTRSRTRLNQLCSKAIAGIGQRICFSWPPVSS